MQIDDLHALELVEATFLLRDITYFCRTLVPVIGDCRESPGEHSAIGGICAAIP